jgi:TonB-linked SusC/RagA family outer membrane protein
MRKIILYLAFVFCASLAGYAQNRSVSGTITDNIGKPIVGASITVKGTKLGTTTNNDGVFQFSVTAAAKTLLINYIGFEAQEIAIAPNIGKIALKPKDASLDEVVVVAYGTQKKEALAGSVGTIKAQDIEKRPLSNVFRAIEGNVPGVVTTSGSGQPGNGLAIRVRGFGSINATQEPLYVVDGVPYVGGTSNINPDDVESITVLKDASATSLYGSRAGNGVVLITTKKGKKGSNNISIRLTQGFSQRGLEEYERVDAFQYYPLMWEAYRNALVYPATGAISIDSASRVASGLTNRTSVAGLLGYNPFNVARNAIVGTNGRLNPQAQLLYPDDLDWTRDLMRVGKRNDLNLNFSGGAEKSDYFVSLGYLKEDGYTIQTDFERFSARINGNVKPLQWLKTGLNFSANYSKFNTADDGTGIVNPFNFSRNIAPIYPVYAHNMTTGAYVLDANGNKIWDLGNFQATPLGIANGIPNRAGTTSGRHASAELVLNDYLSTRWVISGRSSTEINIFKNLKFTNNVAVDFQYDYAGVYENTLVGDGAPAGRSDKDIDATTGLTLNQLLNYNKNFKGQNIDILVGHETFNQHINNLTSFKQGQSLSGNIELGNFTTINSTSSSVDRYRIESFFSRFSYDYDGKYILTASLRRDGNSRFAPESRWGTFWSLGGGWNMHKENFMRGVSWVDNLKLRGSYGVVGVADGIGFYAWQGLYSFANNANEPGIVQNQTAVENRNLTWEVNTQADIGIEFSILKGRLKGSLEYFNRQSKDVLFNVPTPLSSGVLSTQKNTITMFNKGWELGIIGEVVRNKDITFSIGVNLTKLSNQITSMPNGVSDFITGTKKYSVGASLFDYWLRTYYGVDPNDGAALYLADNKTASTGIRYIKNGNGGTDTVTTLVANGKFQYFRGTIPDIYGSLTPTLRFKQITLSALLTFQMGGRTYDANYQNLMSSGTYGTALHNDILRRWQKPGDVTDVPRMDNANRTDFDANSSRWLIDASYFNVRSINISYNFSSKLLSKANAKSAQFYMTIENAFFGSKRVGMNNQNAFSGVTSGAYPPARVFTVGVSMNL